ncbi:MAG: hypothetical protein GQ531_07915 [Sulfurovum sp.]|nr:hypothetical protein [Sulfurovum sp.]
MKNFTLLFLLSLELLFAAELKHVNIGNQDFSITTESYKIYDSKGTVMRMYSEERNNDLLFILNLTLRDTTGPCSSKSIEEGSYEVNATHITLYSSWIRRGKAYDAPIGARIQVFEVQPDHSVKRISSKLYIETERENYNEASGMQYLFKKAKTKKEQAKLDLYIRGVERKYNGTFVFGKEAQVLRREVEKALTKKLKNKWN